MCTLPIITEILDFSCFLAFPFPFFFSSYSFALLIFGGWGGTDDLFHIDLNTFFLILDTTRLSVICVADIISHSVACLFVLFVCLFCFCFLFIEPFVEQKF